MSEPFLSFFQAIFSVLAQAATISGIVWISATLIIYALALVLYRLSNYVPIAHPLVITATALGAILFLTDTSITRYQQSASLIHWLLGPATVALALPMYAQWQRIRHHGWRLIAGIASGGIIAPLVAWAIVYGADAPLALQMTMLVKSITTPLAMDAGAKIGGIPALAAVFVITTGIVGAIVSSLVFSLFRVTDEKAQGLALGTVAHAVGTAKAIQMSEQTGAMATLGLCLNGIMTAIVVPLIFG